MRLLTNSSGTLRQCTEISKPRIRNDICDMATELLPLAPADITIVGGYPLGKTALHRGWQIVVHDAECMHSSSSRRRFESSI